MRMDYKYLVGRIQTALAADRLLGMLDLRLTVHGNVVHITGEIEDEAQRQAIAHVIADQAPGYEVRDETTLLRLSPASPPETIGG
jgi:hypothetical protein